MKAIAISLFALLALWFAPPSGDWDSWSDWWRLHRREYFAATPFDSTVDEHGNATASAKVLEWNSLALFTATAALKSGDGALRRAAAITLARLGDPLGAQKIAPLVSDGDSSVRQGALLALGTLESDEARGVLLGVANGTNTAASSALDVGTAFVALTLCRAGALDGKIDAVLEAKLDSSKKIAREVHSGALLHQKLARVSRLWPATRATALDEQALLEIRCLALEALAGSPESEDYSILAASLQSRELELRRSAALALGVSHDPRAVALLIAGVDGERNAAARGFMILSLGRLATQDAVTRLLLERQRTAALDRAWAWMALGLAARAGNAKARSALDLMLETKLQPGEHATSLVAIGLARQTGALDFLEAAAMSKGDVDLAPFATEGLALMATTPAHALLVARFAQASADTDRLALFDGLARMRVESDAPLLIEQWRRNSSGERRFEAAQTLARHGSASAIEALIKQARDESKTGQERAAALEAVSLALSRRPLDRLAALATNSNFFALDAWILEIARSGL